ncbi:hypothetical protein [Leptospira stimsonii]|uniref:Uncharacterized protein n=1 Tax=Leptospira stimsonii TaxID=2202203 RepID=A0A4R9L9M2_9LEPT|nr:hypothetical protein [Leptospira stimsonii]RHX83118.1 hypothetical protein DLM78_23275 [Leptospira stimsonii]RHX84678.1 hypothetical protein DLM75_22650 [Leptospira stimsonii]TGK23344.1 hypothetical protein EHO98_05450 [Leptospira stimsonii]TGM20985.1 hypothetical protein EHQ90_02520 [Leptospira stimsonii]
MNQNQLRWRNAVLIGIVAGIMEGLLVGLADPNVGTWVLIQSILFWFSCGTIVTLTETGFSKFWSVLIFTEIMNLPWFIALVVIPGNYSHLIPLIVASLIFGSIIGGLNILLKTPRLETK